MHKNLKYRNLKRIITYIIIAFIVLIPVLTMSIFKVSGDSMEPTLQDGDYVLVCKICNYKKSDIVIVNNPKNELSIKRIVGANGDEIELTKNSIYRNGVNLDIPVEKKVEKYSLDDQVFVVGDNYNNSYDSREYGSLDEKEVIGKVLFHT